MRSATKSTDGLYLVELREALEERCGIRISESMIWRMLKRVVFRTNEGGDLI